MTENFSKIIKETKPQIQEARRTSRRISAKHYSQAQYISTALNNKNGKNLERSQSGK